MVRVVCLIPLIMAVQSTRALKAEEQPSPKDKPPEVDLSTLPKINGKVVQVLGNLNSYVPPRVGAEVHWDLKSLSKLTLLPFDPGPEDAERNYYIPLGTGRDGTSPLVVESIKTYGNGAFQNMRLVSRSQIPGSPSVKVDVIPLPGRGDPNFVQIWVVVEADVLCGVVLIEGKSDGPFHKSPPVENPNEALLERTKPIETALEFLREQKTDLSRHDVDRAASSRYCPPQSTVYQWCVNIPARPGSGMEDLWIALPAKGDPWRLDPKTLEKIR